jgi:hypothetical protein
MAVQKKLEQKKDRSESADKQKLERLRHDLNMYRLSIDAFEEDSDEWKICQESIYDLVSEISKLEQKGGGSIGH